MGIGLAVYFARRRSVIWGVAAGEAAIVAAAYAWS